MKIAEERTFDQKYFFSYLDRKYVGTFVAIFRNERAIN